MGFLDEPTEAAHFMFYVLIFCLQNELSLILRDYINLVFKADLNLYCMHCSKSYQPQVI